MTGMAPAVSARRRGSPVALGVGVPDQAVEGVGDMRAKDIREGLRRLQEINLVDRYLQT